MCFNNLNENIKKFKWFDISVLKLCVAAFVLMIAKLWSGILYLEWYWYLIIGLITGIYLICKMFK